MHGQAMDMQWTRSGHRGVLIPTHCVAQTLTNKYRTGLCMCGHVGIRQHKQLCSCMSHVCDHIWADWSASHVMAKACTHPDILSAPAQGGHCYKA